MLEHNHECNDCGNNPKRDECYCRDCYENYARDAYNEGKAEGKKEGYDEGYDAAEREFRQDA